MKKQEQETPTNFSDKVVKAGDDFTIIMGIGSRISYVLYENNVLTFNDLATADIDFIKSLMKQYKLHLADPTTWQQQALLAAEGKMADLNALKLVLERNKKSKS